MVIEKCGNLESLVRISHHRLNQAGWEIDKLEAQNEGLIEKVEDM